MRFPVKPGRKDPEAYLVATTVTPEPLPRDHWWATYPEDDAAYGNIARTRYVAFRRYLRDLGSNLGLSLLLPYDGNHRPRTPSWTIAPPADLFDPTNNASLRVADAETTRCSLGDLTVALVRGVSTLRFHPFDVTLQYDTHLATGRPARAPSPSQEPVSQERLRPCVLL